MNEFLDKEEFVLAITEQRVRAIKRYNQRTKIGLKKSTYIVDLAIKANGCIDSWLKAEDETDLNRDRRTIYVEVLRTLKFYSKGK